MQGVRKEASDSKEISVAAIDVRSKESNGDSKNAARSSMSMNRGTQHMHNQLLGFLVRLERFTRRGRVETTAGDCGTVNRNSKQIAMVVVRVRGDMLSKDQTGVTMEL